MMLLGAENRGLTNVEFCSNLLKKNICSTESVKEDFAMTDNELELLYIIRNNENPEKALEIAIQTIIEFLERSESYQEPSVVCPRVLS